MLTLKRILHPTDFSEYAREAEHYACALARQYGAELHLLNVVEDLLADMPPLGGPGLAMIATNPSQMTQNARQALEAFPNKEWGHDLKVHRAVRPGNAFVEIVRYTREHDVDLIVIGTHGRTGLRHVLMGSVAEHVVRTASCPVLTVRPKTHSFLMP